MNSKHPQMDTGPPQQNYIPPKPRALAPAPASTSYNRAPPQSYPPHYYPPQHYFQPPSHGYNQSPYAYPPAPQHLQQSPSGNYPQPGYNHPPTISKDGVHPHHSLYQATPGGPYRPTPSLAGQTPVKYSTPYPGPLNPKNQTPSPHPPHSNNGNWHQNVSQHVNGPGGGMQTGIQAENLGWQQPHGQNFYGHTLGPVITKIQEENPIQEEIVPKKKAKKPRLSKKNQGEQLLPGNGQNSPDPQATGQLSEGNTPTKKIRKPRVSKKNPNPRQDTILTSGDQTSPDSQSIDSSNQGTAPVKKPRKPKVSKKKAIILQGMAPLANDEQSCLEQQATNQPDQEITSRKNSKTKVLKGAHGQASNGMVAFEDFSSSKRLKSRQVLDESSLDHQKHEILKSGRLEMPIATTELRETTGLKRFESRQSILVADSSSDEEDEADDQEGDCSEEEEEEDEDGDEDEDESEDNIPDLFDRPTMDELENESGSDDEYDTIMSQVNKYKGGIFKAMGGRQQDNPAGFGLLTALANIEPPKEASEEGDVSIPSESNLIRKVRHRGPHPAAEVTGEIKLRLGRANEAFSESRIDEAKNLVDEIIRINAETYEAWNLLSSIFQEQNQVEDALMALIVAAHLRPKHIEAWFNAGDYALTSMGPVTDKLLVDAQFCFSSAIRQVPTSLEARRRKIQVVLMRGNYNLAARDLAYLLRTVPYDLELIRELAMVYIDLGDGMAGAELYRKAIEHYRTNPDDFELSIDWNDLHTCAVLHSLMEKGKDSLKEMKSLARWLLGREEETFWDDITENDCEWDVDDTRRTISTKNYVPGNFPLSSYGEGLPVELRVYFGKYRLKLEHFEEAMRHFKLLLAKNGDGGDNMVQSHAHLVIDIADSFYESQQYREALVFYEALKHVPDGLTAEAYLHMGKCYLHDDRADEAESALRKACTVDEENIEARIELARMYERMDEAEQAFVYVNQVLELESIKQPKMYRRRRGNFTLIESNPAKSFLPITSGEGKSSHRRQEKDDLESSKAALAAGLRDRYSILRKETDGMRAGKPRATDAWMDAARALTEDFRTCRAFYPWDRKEFDGYTAEEALQAKTSLRLDLEMINQEHAENLGSQSLKEQSKIPNHYRGISFKDWIDLFCEYALCLAKRGRSREAYDVCEAGIHAICFMFSKQDMFMLHIAYCVCALIGNDEETCVGMARWFMVRYQFCTDSYRMFEALLRMCHSPISWYSSGPTQKFILRQIKTMDWVLSNEERRNIIKGDKANYTQHDEFGKTIVNEELDVSLLMAYGHILVAGSSFVYALNYFHRALSLDPDNPMIILSAGLSYIQYGLKRQVDNRQFVITQGLTLMHRYYDLRLKSPHFEERQEAHYNMARCYHLVALTNLAIPFYRKVLKGAEDEENIKGVDEDWCIDAAYNLQTIYTTAGNMELAQSLTRRWLVI